MTDRSGQEITLLVVEDEPAHQQLVRSKLSDAGSSITCEFADTCSDALTKLLGRSYDCVLLDHNLPDGTGDDLLRKAESQLIATPVVSFSTSLDPDVELAELRHGSISFLPKREAFRNDALVRAIDGAVGKCRRRAAVERSGSAADLIRRAGELLTRAEDTEPNERDIEQTIDLIYETAITTIKDGIVLFDASWRVLYANPAFRNLLGLSDQDELPRHPATSVHDLFVAGSAHAIATGSPARDTYEGVVRRIDASPVPVQISESRLGEGGLLLAVTDLREIKNHQAQLEEKNRRLAELNETANRFVDNVSHEFRTPLTVIKGYADVLSHGLAGPICEEQQNCLRTIIDRTGNLAQMVDDLLDSSKLRAGRLRVDRRSQSVASIVDSIRSSVNMKADANGVTIEYDLPDGLPLVYADGEKVGRILLNLVVNAIKFSDEGGVVRLWGRETSSGDVEVGVTDAGPGIDEANLKLIFERFQQVDGPQRSSTRGFGLGLSIASELVAMNLGHMDVDSTVGQGSTFTFDLPRAEAHTVGQRLLAQLPRNSANPTYVALLQIKTRTSAPVDDRLRAFIASELLPTDLVLAGRTRDTLVIFGTSQSPTSWRDRLQRACDDAVDSAGALPGRRVEIELLTVWEPSRANKAAACRALASKAAKEGAI